MKITLAKSISDLLECVPFEREIYTKGRETTKVDKLLHFLEAQLENPYFRFWIAREEGDVIGYFVAMISLIPKHERIHLIRMYAKSDKLREELLDKGREWANEYNIKIVQMTVTSHVKAFQRRWKFKPVSVNMERRI